MAFYMYLILVLNHYILIYPLVILAIPLDNDCIVGQWLQLSVVEERR